VLDPKAAIQEIKRLVRPSGGTFGYVEHVAVNPSEPYRFLEWQQTTLDPLQQFLADNCHLHRYTQETIRQVFLEESNEKARAISEDRFLVDKMWPVTSQCCGVIQRQAVL
jgi:ubiquinone/menaquinone biosynthesis C-methylase UbiE